MRFPLSLPLKVPFVLVSLCLGTACSDDRPERTGGVTTAPEKPALTLNTLPNDAPTICVASVQQRDRLLADAHPTAATARNLTALNDVIDDVCR